MVTVYFEGTTQSVHFVTSNELERLLEATVELHHDPGINPHNQGKTARAVRITGRKIRMDKRKVHAYGPYWWSTPGLANNDDPRGAKIYGGDIDPSDYDQVVEKQLWAA